MYICPVLWGGNIKKLSTTRPKENEDPGGNATPTNKKELQAFLGVINYLGTFSPSRASELQKLTSSRTVWTWNASYQALYDKTKSLIMADICMKFYNETKPLYLKTGAFGIGLGATLFQTRDGTTCPKDITLDNTILRLTAFACKSLTNVEQRYSNIEREALGILLALEKIHHYCLLRR